MIINSICSKSSYYPKVSISDSVISSIKIEGKNLIIYFDCNGFWVKRDSTSVYRRVDNARLKLCNCNIDDADIFVLTPKKFLQGVYKIKEGVEFSEFINKINSNLWELEVVQEYFYDVGGLIVGRIREKDFCVDCYMQVEYSQKEYIYEENVY